MRHLLVHRASPLAAVLLLGAGTASADVVRVGDTFLIEDPPSCTERTPDVAMLPGGGSLAVWTEQGGNVPPPANEPTQVVARALASSGEPLGPERFVALAPGVAQTSPVVDTDADGDAVAVWIEGARKVMGRRLDGAGRPAGPAFVVAQPGALRGVALDVAPDGSFVVVLTLDSAIYYRRYDRDGRPRELPALLTEYGHVTTDPPPPVRFPSAALGADGSLAVAWTVHGGLVPRQAGALQVSDVTFDPGGSVRDRIDFAPDTGDVQDPVVALTPDGGFALAWSEVSDSGAPGGIWLQLFDELGRPHGAKVRADLGSWLSLGGTDLVVAVDGTLVVSWRGYRMDDQILAQVRAFAPDGAPLGPPLTIGEAIQGRVALAVDDQDRLVAVWAHAPTDQITPTVICPENGLVAQRLALEADGEPLCGPERLCLRDGRFTVEVEWTDFAGGSGAGRAVPLTADTGAFWFFNQENVELVVKILDGRSVNSHFWVFYGALSNVGYEITVTDEETGARQTYVNPPRTLASHADTEAFPSLLSTSAAPASTTTTATFSTALTAPSHAPGEGGGAAGPCTDPQLPVVPRPGLCLRGEFEVEVAWHDPFGGSGVAEGVAVSTDSGYLWFFDKANVELMVKVLDGRGVNGHFWVFYGALSNVEYTIRVKHLPTGQERIYRNPPGTLASRADTEAFALP